MDVQAAGLIPEEQAA